MAINGKQMTLGALWMGAVVSMLLLAACAVPVGEDLDTDNIGLSGQGGPCTSTDDCDFALRCLQRRADRVCVQPCRSSSECASQLCNPVPGSSAGWCDFSGENWLPDDHTPPGDGDRAPTPPGDEGAPPVDEPPADDPWVDENPQDNNPDPQPAPQPEPIPEPEPEPEPECVFNPGSSLGMNQTVPNLRWQGAIDGNGGTRDFSFESFKCDPEYADKSVIVMVMGTGWCGACPQYFRSVASSASAIEAAGGQIVFVELEDSSYQPVNHSQANQIISRYVSNGAGLRIGDGQTMPNARYLLQSGIARAYPQAIVIRKSDMTIVANQNSSGYMLDFVQLAQQHGGGNSNPGPGPAPGGSCTDNEEQYEPNNNVSSAAAIGAGSFDAAVCETGGDYYAIDIPGAWRLDLQFSHARGDVDVYVWDTIRNQPVRDGNNRPIGSDSPTDNESFTHIGQAVIRVLGYEGATNTYSLTLTPQ